jgi:glutamine synthetase
MTGNTRQQAINSIALRTSQPFVNKTDKTPEELFGADVFGLAAMKAHLPKHVFRSVKRTIDAGEMLDPAVADVVASALKDWAVAKGATHYAHVFLPLTGATAEKHDSFLSPDGEGGALSEFSGKALVQGEPDASSFPHGGIRSTFEARGYTAWDVTSPAYVLDGQTLCIPTAFVSWTGEALDKKTPILRSTQALNTQAQRILKLFGHEKTDKVVSYAGAEQEYFLIDRQFYLQRPDIVASGRSLFGAKPPKGQEFEDHYFGAIPERIQAFMCESEHELFKLGVPVKTRHNEVAPGQFEVAPVFENGNVATDHQQLVMMVMRKVAERQGMTVLFHEKPFAGINGNGKHVNFSIGNGTQGNLLDPGDTPHENAQFLVFCGAVIRAVSKFAPVLRAVIASASNDHRLGANEAPPAIISIYLGDQLADVFEQIKGGGAKTSKGRGTLEIGVDTLPKLPKDPGDRNRTSPFAFTGNRFEFRAVGGGQSIADPITALNTMVAESIDYVATKLEGAVKAGKPLNQSIQTVLQEIITEHGSVVFNGDGYSAEWHAEAEKRGLPNLKNAPAALPALQKQEVIDLFDKYKVLTPRELHGRYEVYLEHYVKSVRVEANITLKLGKTSIMPAALRYQAELAGSAAAAKALGLPSAELKLPGKLATLIVDLEKVTDALEGTLAQAHGHADLLKEAQFLCDKLIPAMNKVRETGDALEAIVADDLWPLPTYQEMLFIR